MGRISDLLIQDFAKDTAEYQADPLPGTVIADTLRANNFLLTVAAAPITDRHHDFVSG